MKNKIRPFGRLKKTDKKVEKREPQEWDNGLLAGKATWVMGGTRGGGGSLCAQEATLEIRVKAAKWDPTGAGLTWCARATRSRWAAAAEESHLPTLTPGCRCACAGAPGPVSPSRPPQQPRPVDLSLALSSFARWRVRASRTSSGSEAGGRGWRGLLTAAFKWCSGRPCRPARSSA